MGNQKFYIAGIGIFDLFGSFDLDLDPMTFVYEPDPYFRMYKYELMNFLRQGFRKLSSDRQTHSRSLTMQAAEHRNRELVCSLLRYIRPVQLSVQKPRQGSLLLHHSTFVATSLSSLWLIRQYCITVVSE